MKWLREIMRGGAISHMVRLPEPVDHTVIPVNLEVGEWDQVVLIADRMLSEDDRRHIVDAWEAGTSAGKPIVLEGSFSLKVLKDVRRPKP